MIIKIKKTLVFSENFMSTETFLLCYKALSNDDPGQGQLFWPRLFYRKC